MRPAPFGHKIGWRLAAGEERVLAAWVALNCKVLQDIWDGVIDYTEDALER